MSLTTFIVLFAVLVKSGFGLDCTQIPSTSIFAGSTVHLPGPSNQLQVIPANWNCQYNISAPGNSTNGLFADVVIQNQLRGVNDYISVVDQSGESLVMNSNHHPRFSFSVLPGAEMTIQVVTKSVDMGSMFEITVEYSNVQIGPTFPMKTGGEMNFIDVASLRNGETEYNSVTFVGTEPIYVTQAIPIHENCDWCFFVIDGTIDNQTRIRSSREGNLFYEGFTTKSNAITIVSSFNKNAKFVFNPKSEADNFYKLHSMAVDDSSEDNDNFFFNSNGKPGAVQVVNFETSRIIMDRFEIFTQNCTAYVVSGPPNNSSKVLLDLSNSPEMPHSFDVKYFSVVAEDCGLRFYVRGN